MNWTAPALRRLFAWNHKKVMDEGCENLARYLKAPLVSDESRESEPESAAPPRLRAPRD